MMPKPITLAAFAFVSACSAYDGMKRMEKNTEEMNRTTRDMYETTRAMQASTEALRQKTEDMSDDTKAMRRATEDMVHKTSDLARTTDEMSETTKAMHETTREVKNTSDEVSRQTGDLYEDNRQGLSLELRLKILDSMQQTKKQFAKIKYANFYFKSLEFQLWKGSGRDDSEHLDKLRLEAVQEVIQTIDELVPAGKRSLSPTSSQSAMQNLYALSAALHVINQGGTLPDLELAVTDRHEYLEHDTLPTSENHKPTGVLKLFYDALGAKAAIAAGDITPDDLKAYESSALKFEDIMTYILRLRVNFLAAIAVKQLATEDNSDVHLFHKISMWIKPWQARIDSRNVVQLRYFGWVLGEAIATRDALASLGVEVPFDKTLKKVILNMRFGNATLDPNGEKSAAIKVLEQRFLSLAHGT